MASSGAPSQTPRRKSVVWDEKNLEENEASKEPHMKITEPKTPYHHAGIPLDDEADHSATIGEQVSGANDIADEQVTPPGSPRDHADAKDRLNEVSHAIESASKHQTNRSSVEFSPSQVAHLHETPEEIEKKKEFEKRRKAHYDEYIKISKLKQSSEDDEDDA